jgi:uncharacterized protein (DUF1330 family)
MPKVFWVSIYREIRDPAKLAAYAVLAGPALIKHGGKFLARGLPSEVYEDGLKERIVLIEFESVDAARKAHDSPEYTKALEALGDGVVREIRIVEGIPSSM